MNNNKREKVLSNAIDTSVLTEMALPRMSKSARIAELNLKRGELPIGQGPPSPAPLKSCSNLHVQTNRKRRRLLSKVSTDRRSEDVC
jgi:hypothetical protein